MLIYDFDKVTGQFANKPTHCQLGHRLIYSWTNQLTKAFNLKFAVNNYYKCDLQ